MKKLNSKNKTRIQLSSTLAVGYFLLDGELIEQ